MRPLFGLLLGLGLAVPAYAAERTVCSVSCDYAGLDTALADAETGDQIRILDDRTYEVGQLDLPTSVTQLLIEATGSPIIEGPAGLRWLLISGSTVTLRGMTFDGLGDSGLAAVHDGGTLHIDDVYVRSTEPLDDGSAVWVGAGSTLTATDSHLTQGSAGGYRGGLVYAGPTAQVTLEDCQLDYSVAELGGAVYLDDAVLSASRTTFHANDAQVSGAHVHATNGSVVSVDSSTFTASNATESGGAIFAWDSATTVTASHFSGTNGGDHGGAIAYFDHAGRELVVSDTLFEDTNATYSGGAILFRGEHADSSLVLDGNTFYSAYTVQREDFQDVGGAVRIEGKEGTATALLTGNSFAQNRAYRGAALSAWQLESLRIAETTFESLGHTSEQTHVHIAEVGSTHIEASVFTELKAELDGAALWVLGGGDLVLLRNTFTGNVSTEFNGVVFVQDTASLVSQDGRYVGNKAALQGGAFYLQSVGEATFERDRFRGNEGGTRSNDFGGAILAYDTDVAVHRGVFERNGGPSTDWGGAIMSWGGGDLTVTNSTFLSNHAASTGCAIGKGNGLLTVSHSVFLDHAPTFESGAVVEVDHAGLEFTHNVVVWSHANGSRALRGSSPSGTPTIEHNLFGIGAVYLDLAESGPNLYDAEPGFYDYALGMLHDRVNLRPRPDSPLIDGGIPGVLDLDGTVADIGLYGGLAADPAAWEDFEGDGIPWVYDCNDRQPDVGMGLPELCDGLDNDCDGVADDGVDEDHDQDGFTRCQGDCAPHDQTIFPGAPERCDGVSTRCEGEAPEDERDLDGDGYVACALDIEPWDGIAGGDDCDDADDRIFPATLWYADVDKDGAGDPNDSVVACERPGTHVLDDTDCDDLDASEHPGAVWYADDDDDGFGDPDGSVTACERPTAHVSDATDCAPDNALVFPGAVERCDGVPNSCGAPLPANERDDDGDDYVECTWGAAPWVGDGDVVGGGDCDDTHAVVHPGAVELCNGVLDDCTGAAIPAAELDLDGDGYVACGSPGVTWLGAAIAGGGDCAPLQPTVFPGAPALCDGLVNDCGASALPAAELDLDSDGVVACTFASGGWHGAAAVWADNDCDDADPYTYPGASELCDGLVNDCDATALPGAETDDDGDGWVECVTVTVPWGELSGGGDCNDTAAAIHPAAAEICDPDDVDEDCDGLSDDDDPSVTGGTDLYPDFDGDGFGSNLPTAVVWCDLPGGDWVTDHSDCHDGDAAVYPGATEVAYDFVDQDCDGQDLCDVDDDGQASVLCQGLDCDDADPTVFSGAEEAYYDGVDQDCDGQSDNDADADGFDAASKGGLDCDDSDAGIRPNALDVAGDDIDQDCDGKDGQGCGCATSPAPLSSPLALLFLVGLARTRRAR